MRAERSGEREEDDGDGDTRCADSRAGCLLLGCRRGDVELLGHVDWAFNYQWDFAFVATVVDLLLEPFLQHFGFSSRNILRSVDFNSMVSTLKLKYF